jgi:hypothetical protein
VSTQRRGKAVTSSERPVKTTLTLDVELHSRLCAKAARRRMGVSALAVEFIRTGLKGLVVIDRSESSDRSKGEDRTRGGLGVIDSDEDAA